MGLDATPDHEAIPHPRRARRGKGSAHGAATFALRDGRLVIAGRVGGGSADTLAVVGGTGAYAGATGTVRITEGNRRTAFRFTLG